MKNSVEHSSESIPSRDYFKCVSCEQHKPLEAFAPSARRGARWRCRVCLAEYQRELRRAGYSPTGRNSAIRALPTVERAKHYWANAALDSAKGNARKRGIPCTLTRAELLALWEKQLGKCALSGLPLGTEKNSQYIASIDQLQPRGGYVVENIRLVVWAANRGRGAMSDAEFIQLCREVVRCNDYPERE